MMADDTTTTKAKPKRMAKAALLQAIANSTKLTRKQVADVFDFLTAVIKQELSEKGPGEFALPGLLVLQVVRKPATPERRGRNPFKPGEEIVIKAKPARNIVRARALKMLKNYV
jgi:nucleoid DNA-binding protein